MSFGVFFEITDLCNHKCIHCCKTWRVDGNHTMDKSKLDIILSYPKDFLTISGGEPALAKDKVRYMCENEKSFIAINTNLTLWNQEDINYLNKKVIWKVSVPSTVKSEYEKITEANTYNQLMTNLKLINKNSIMTIIVNEHTINTLQITIEDLAYLGFSNFVVQPQIPTDFATVDVKKALRNIEDVFVNKRNLNIKLLCYSEDSIIPINHSCDAGIGRFVVLSNGNVVPCACYHAPLLGNILTTSFEELKQNGNEYFNQYKDKKTCKGFQNVREKHS